VFNPKLKAIKITRALDPIYKGQQLIATSEWVIGKRAGSNNDSMVHLDRPSYQQWLEILLARRGKFSLTEKASLSVFPGDEHISCPQGCNAGNTFCMKVASSQVADSVGKLIHLINHWTIGTIFFEW
jgi:hypothetical protein